MTTNGTPAGPPLTEEEHEALLAEVRDYMRRILVLALARLDPDHLAIIRPGLVSADRRSNDRHGAQLILEVPDEMVVNFRGPADERDLVLLVHIPRSAQRMLEGLDQPLLHLPD
jgi:hypothetical protein